MVRLVVRRLVEARLVCFLHYGSPRETRRLTPLSQARHAEDPRIESKKSKPN